MATASKKPKKAAEEISLEALNAACRDCRSREKMQWSRAELRERLTAAEATCDLVGIDACPPENRKALLSDVGHHPSWWKVKKAFCAKLPHMGIGYDELALACEALGLPRPSHMDHLQRDDLSFALARWDSPVRKQLREQAEARAAAAALPPAAPPLPAAPAEMDPPAPISAPAPAPVAAAPRRAAVSAEAFFRPGPAVADARARAHALESSTRTDSDAIRAKWPADVRHTPADRLSEPFLSELLTHLEFQWSPPGREGGSVP